VHSETFPYRIKQRGNNQFYRRTHASQQSTNNHVVIQTPLWEICLSCTIYLRI